MEQVRQRAPTNHRKFHQRDVRFVHFCGGCLGHAARSEGGLAAGELDDQAECGLLLEALNFLNHF